MINDEEVWGEIYAEIFNCQLGAFPVKYLGVLVSPSRLHSIDWFPLTKKCNKRLDVWKGGNMTMAGRTAPVLTIHPCITCQCSCCLKQLPNSLISLEELSSSKGWDQAKISYGEMDKIVQK